MPDLEDVAAASLGPVEHRRFVACPPGERERFFYDCWTRKEAWLKATGSGLRVDPRAADTCAAPGWAFHAIAAPAGCAGHVATRLAAATIVLRTSQ